MVTNIYTGSGTADELIKVCHSRFDHIFIDVWFPEHVHSKQRGFGQLPASYKEQIAIADTLIGRSFCTMSEIIILSFLKKVDQDDLEVELYCDGIRIDIKDGEIHNWPGGFFRERAELLFYE
jgi:hypothetical protein